jgi:hypothetical protein
MDGRQQTMLVTDRKSTYLREEPNHGTLAPFIISIIIIIIIII